MANDEYLGLSVEERDAITGILAEVSEVKQVQGFEFELGLKLVRFALLFRESNGIHAMHDWCIYCNVNGFGDERKWASIAHDLRDMNEPLFAPRTGPYLGYQKETTHGR